MEKLQRNYKLVYTLPVEDKKEPVGEQITIKYPLTCEFSITRNTYAQANTATFKIYNLSLVNRNKIFQDKYNINRWCFVEFYAGYGENMPLIFKGKVLNAFTLKKGNNNVTTINCLDSAIYGYSSKTFEVGTPKIDVLKTLINDLPNTNIGAIGTIEGNLGSHFTAEGKTYDVIRDFTGGAFFIDNSTGNLLNNNEVIGDISIYKLNSKSGLLGTPKRADAQIEVDVIFAPEITVGQLVEIESVTAPDQFNGQYKVIGISHNGIISGAVCGEATTKLNLFVGAFLPNSNWFWTGVSATEPVSEVKGDSVIPVSIEEQKNIKAVYQYLLKNGQPPKWKITKNIWWTEALLNYSKQGSTPSINILTNLYSAARQLQSFVDRYYTGNKIIITSGWRSSNYNRAVGGVPDSQHIQGKAFDFYLPGQINYYVYKNFKNYWRGWSQVYSTWIHGDIRSVTKGVANDK